MRSALTSRTCLRVEEATQNAKTTPTSHSHLQETHSCQPLWYAPAIEQKTTTWQWHGTKCRCCSVKRMMIRVYNMVRVIFTSFCGPKLGRFWFQGFDSPGGSYREDISLAKYESTKNNNGHHFYHPNDGGGNGGGSLYHKGMDDVVQHCYGAPS